MKKYLLVFLFLLAFNQTAQSQALLIILFGDKLSTETFQMGINASLSASDLIGKEYKTKVPYPPGVE